MAAQADRSRLRLTPRSDGSTRRSGPGSMGRNVGTATTAQPAPSAALTPAGESSSARHRAVGTPSRRAASRYGSGSGLPRVTSLPHTTTGNRRPVRASTASTNRRCEDVTSAYGRPDAATSATRLAAPGITATPRSRIWSTIPPMIHSATAAGSGGTTARARK